MECGIGVDPTLRLSFDDQRALAREAASLGYDSIWTNASATGIDPFHQCAQFWAASAEVRPGGLKTGISVVPVPTWTVLSLAAQAATLGVLTDGRFTLGIGTGSFQEAGFRRTYGLPEQRPVDFMRDYLVPLRQLLAGEEVDYAGAGGTLRGVKLGVRPPTVPVYLGALGPLMLRLAGEAADGALPNWCTPEQTVWCRERMAEGAARAGRVADPLPVVQYIRICVDEDEKAARRALARQVLSYALVRPGGSPTQGYRAHFARMGFDVELTDLESCRAAGVAEDELLDACPEELLRAVGYYGSADGAAAEFRRIAAGLDVAIARVVVVRPGLASAQAVLRACAPERVG
jgi:alkanesulfonate monooxygenase SsuD/methylene tetrahydromethanopterin reductase-like flavin-dependent oxidoreductase (luciferase family)